MGRKLKNDILNVISNLQNDRPSSYYYTVPIIDIQEKLREHDIKISMTRLQQILKKLLQEDKVQHVKVKGMKGWRVV